MRRLCVGLSIFALIMICEPAAVAQSADEAAVMEAFNAWIAARNTGDAETICRSWTREGSYFGSGSLLFEFEASYDQLLEIISGQFEGGRQDNLIVHNLQARIVGDMAVLTCYMSGTFSPDPETNMEGPWTFSSVWVKEGNTWKLTHMHQSQLAGGPFETLSGIVD
jgi:uncharacterized protein (TIGR02246 family)